MRDFDGFAGEIGAEEIVADDVVFEGLELLRGEALLEREGGDDFFVEVFKVIVGGDEERT